jgi:cobalt/nickel transport system permease protein
MTTHPLFAVHISPGILAAPWVAGGYAVMAVAVAAATWRIDDRDIPRVGVLTAAVFVASQFHLPFGVISLHLLLNGLAGVILRHRAPLAVAVGLTLQALLFGHGGLDSLGVNFVVLAAPAVAAGLLFPPLARRVRPIAAGVLVGGLTAAVTVVLNATALYLGAKIESDEPRKWIAGVSLVAHLPVIAVEAAAVGFACRVLAKAKPEWLGIPSAAEDIQEG